MKEVKTTATYKLCKHLNVNYVPVKFWIFKKTYVSCRDCWNSWEYKESKEK